MCVFKRAQMDGWVDGWMARVQSLNKDLVSRGDSTDCRTTIRSSRDSTRVLRVSCILNY